MFKFQGPILTSKSWLNRAIVVHHFNPEIELDFRSASDDVISLKNSIDSITKTKEFHLGMGGTSLRFFVPLISRHKGEWVVRAHERLLDRPQQELSRVLLQLGVEIAFSNNEFLIKSKGWIPASKINCSAELSTQFASGLLLSCWGLEFDIEIDIAKPIKSFGYLQMTFAILKEAGMNIKINDGETSLNIFIPKNQHVRIQSLKPEADISSAFSLLACAAVDGEALITNWPQNSNQPDKALLEIFNKMGIQYELNSDKLYSKKQNSWNSIEVNLGNSPDLFPVLAMLCALARGTSILYGAKQLIHKESNRIHKTHELLTHTGFKTEILEDGLKIYGQSSDLNQDNPIVFDPDHDHRMAMAAAVLKLKGFNIQIKNQEVVNKSYPNFWKDIGLPI